MIDKKELIQIFEQFLNETGNWYRFTDFAEKEGYTIEELGFSEDE